MSTQPTALNRDTQPVTALGHEKGTAMSGEKNRYEASALTPGIAHMLGDYVVQSDWMANEKTSGAVPAAAHAVTYAACFLPLTRSLKALAVIGGTHYLIDRYRLAKRVVWAKNQAAPQSYRYPFSEGQATGYPDDRPAWMTVWLMIAADNTIHLAINHLALRRWAA